VSHINRVVPFEIELRRFGQYLSGAKLNAKPTPLAPILQDFNLTVARLHLVPV